METLPVEGPGDSRRQSTILGRSAHVFHTEGRPIISCPGLLEPHVRSWVLYAVFEYHI